MAGTGFCTKCGTPREPGDKFCASCGAPLKDAGSTSATAPASKAAAKPTPVAATTPSATPAPAPAPSSATAPMTAAAPATGSVTFADLASRAHKLFWIGAGVAVVATFLPWISVEGAPSGDAFDFSFLFLFDYQTTSQGGFSIGLLMLLVVAGAVFLLLTRKGPNWLVKWGPGLAALVPLLYVIQLYRYADAFGAGIMDFLGFGTFVAIAAGGVMTYGALKGPEGTAAVGTTSGPLTQSATQPQVVQPAPTVDGWNPGRRVPAGGMDAYAEPDPSLVPVHRLDAGLDLELVTQKGDWAQIRASNGWSGWVDARRLTTL